MKDFSIGFSRASATSDILVVGVPGFSMLALGAILEPLCFVARAFPDQLSGVRLVTVDLPHPLSASGVRITGTDTIAACCDRIERGFRPGAVFICGGASHDEAANKPLLRLMRACNRQNALVFTMGAATALLARSGIIRGGAATIQWRAMAALAEAHRDISVEEALFLRTGNHTTCAGEAAALDMTLAFIRDKFSAEVARSVFERFVVSLPRPGSDRQPGSAKAVAERLPGAVKTMIELMCDHLELPVKLAALCRATAVSQRQIERMFRKHLGTSPGRYYVQMRLDRARQLIEHTNLPMHETAMACGFHSQANLSRRYQARFGITPAAARQGAIAGALAL